MSIVFQAPPVSAPEVAVTVDEHRRRVRVGDGALAPGRVRDAADLEAGAVVGVRAHAQQRAADGPGDAAHLEAQIRAGGGRRVRPQLRERRRSRVLDLSERTCASATGCELLGRRSRSHAAPTWSLRSPAAASAATQPTRSRRARARRTGQRGLRPCMESTVGRGRPPIAPILVVGRPGRAAGYRAPHPLAGPACPPRHRRRRRLLRHRRGAAARARRAAHHAAHPQRRAGRGAHALAPQRALPARGSSCRATCGCGCSAPTRTI